ncbi:ATP-binding protein [Embleya hyalina]|uniref:DNA mismatch repair protein MutL n=1 Tax=Embleya hyalina TaxID=516124 RepID=A0A401YYI1_9ACTN|nr:ATP-binding protein [Embleya hyalina]GCD99651.1 DNA mismatch repair protein MutL [Embleya hyalina]
MRNLGYTVQQSVADLVDNSVSAGATEVAVTFKFDGSASWISVADNGHGMDARQLTEALRYGSNGTYGNDDLGRFGFGLKTASTSHCREVTVATKAKRHVRVIGRRLDLDHIETTDKWQIFELAEGDLPEAVLAQLRSRTGTVVLWRRLDRVLRYEDPFGGWARNNLAKVAEEVDAHLGMVFHKFIAGEIPKRAPLRITINGSVVDAWDPFCRDEAETYPFPEEHLTVGSTEGAAIVRVRPFILPRQSHFSSKEAWRRANGIKKWNRQQGFYIYRGHRLIQSGGWNKMRAVDEHTKLARVAIEFFPQLDHAFGLNVAKATVRLPSELRERLTPLVPQWIRAAERTYRDGQSKPRPTRSAAPAAVATRSPERPQADALRPPPSPSSSTTGRPQAPRAAFAPIRTFVPASPMPDSGGRARVALEAAAASVGEDVALHRIVAALRDSSPEVARDLGW